MNKRTQTAREDLHTIIIVYIDGNGMRKGCKWHNILMLKRESGLELKPGTKKKIALQFPTAFLIDVYGGVTRNKLTTIKLDK